MTKPKEDSEVQEQLKELTLDLQRTRADFENYRKRVELEKSISHANGRISAIEQLLPVIDTIERAITHVPENLRDNPWAQGIIGASKFTARRCFK